MVLIFQNVYLCGFRKNMIKLRSYKYYGNTIYKLMFFLRIIHELTIMFSISYNQNFLTNSTLLSYPFFWKSWLYHALATRRHCIATSECSNSRSNTKRFNLIFIFPKQTSFRWFIWGGTSHLIEILLHKKNIPP